MRRAHFSFYLFSNFISDFLRFNRAIKLSVFFTLFVKYKSSGDSKESTPFPNEEILKYYDENKDLFFQEEKRSIELARFENENGSLGTNPEELIAAALAGCFNMKLSFVLNDANFNPEELNTEALLTFEDGKVISIQLDLKAKVLGIKDEKFIELAEDAKENCPISGVLNCEIILNASLV